MTFDELHRQLSAPFPPALVSWRVGSTNKEKTRGMALAYIDARDVMDRLDAVVGPENWQCDYPHANGKTVCRIGLRVDDGWVWKADGAGDTEYEAEKGALSDAFKRAAVRWGIGRYLYHVASPWVAVEQKDKSYVIAESEMTKLQALLQRSQPNEAAADRSPPKPAPQVEKQPEPIPPPNDPPPPMPLSVADDLIADIKRRPKTESLQRLKESEDFKAKWRNFTEDEQGRVRREYENRRAHLLQAGL